MLSTADDCVPGPSLDHFPLELDWFLVTLVRWFIPFLPCPVGPAFAIAFEVFPLLTKVVGHLR
ncbi:hypothetical protein LguiA_020423 [Lonicera macranthoides]